MKIRSHLSIFFIALFISINFQVTAQGLDMNTFADNLINSTSLENSTIQYPSILSTVSSSLNNSANSTQQPTAIMSTSTFAQLTNESQFSSTTAANEKKPASNLTSLPPTNLTSLEQKYTSTIASLTSGTDSFTWSHPPSIPVEQTTPQITNQTEYDGTNASFAVMNFTLFDLDSNSTPIDPLFNMTENSTPALMIPDDTHNSSTSATPFTSTAVEDDLISNSTLFEMIDVTGLSKSESNSTNTTEQNTKQPLGSTETLTSENPIAYNISNTENSTEMEFNVTSVPELGFANGTNPSTRNSTERFSDVDATPLQETASLTSSSSMPSVTSTDIWSSYTVSISTEAETSTTPLSTIPQAAPTKWFMLQFTGNCTEIEKRFDDFKKRINEKILFKAGIRDHQVTVNAINCTNSFFLNVSVSLESEGRLSQFFSNLETTTNSTNKFHISDETYLLNVINSVGDSAYHQPPEVTLSSKHTDIEFVIYVALGSTCVFLLSLAVILVACKYCRSKPYKSFDLNDISHLSLGLEDFTLTRIPRPKSTIYNDFGPGIGNKNQYSPIDQQGEGRNGMVHSYDTSVVPLEDAPNFKSENETEPQIVGKSTQTTPTNHEYEEIDVKGVKSTENLHSLPNVASKQWGVDNASFSTP